MGTRESGLAARTSIRSVFADLMEAVPASFIELSVDRETVAELTEALRASGSTLTALVLSADACYRIARCTPEEAEGIGEAIRALALPVRVTITGAVTSLLENPSLDPAGESLWMPLIFPDLNASNEVIRTARLLLRNAPIASVLLPPLDIFSFNLRVQAGWDLLLDLFSADPQRLRCSDMLFNLCSLDAEITAIEEDDPVDLTVDGVKANMRRLFDALFRHDVATLCIYADNGDFVLPPSYLRTMRVSRLQIKETSEVSFDRPQLVSYATFIANNLHIREVELYRQAMRDFDDGEAPFAFVRAMLGNGEHEFPGGVVLFSCEYDDAPPSTQPLDEVLGRLRLGARLCLDLKNVKWEYSTIQAIERALVSNPDVRHLGLTVLSLLSYVPKTEAAFCVPPHVTSASLHVHPWSFQLLFERGASLPGLEVLEVDFTDHYFHNFVMQDGALASVLQGAPKLRRLVLSLSGTFVSPSRS